VKPKKSAGESSHSDFYRAVLFVCVCVRVRAVCVRVTVPAWGFLCLVSGVPGAGAWGGRGRRCRGWSGPPRHLCRGGLEAPGGCVPLGSRFSLFLLFSVL
jgi:hypothetical protein